jgi:hypothetical protein
LAERPVGVVEHRADVVDIVGKFGGEIEAWRGQYVYLARAFDLIPEVIEGLRP